MEKAVKSGWAALLIGIFLMAGASAVGVFDPIDGCASCHLVFAETVNLSGNSHSHYMTYQMRSDRIAIKVKSADPAQVDYLIRLSWGELSIELNPAGYIGVLPDRPLAPFPHVDPSENELIMIHTTTGPMELWLNRELVWTGKREVGTSLAIEIQTYANPVEVELRGYSDNS